MLQAASYSLFPSTLDICFDSRHSHTLIEHLHSARQCDEQDKIVACKGLRIQ